MSQAIINVRNRETRQNIINYKNSNKQFTGLIFLLIVFGTIIWGSCIIMRWIKESYSLQLSQLVITGNYHYTTNDDIRQAIISLGEIGTFITQNVNVIQQQIICIPWIKQAYVRKQWPDKLRIHLIEYVPVAYWNDLYLLDNNGKIFKVPIERTKNQLIPMLYGPEGKEQDVLIGYRVMNKLLTVAKFKLKAVNMNSRQSWQLTLQNGIKLKLGRDDRIKRLQRFIRLYPVLVQQAKNDNKHISYIDLRYDTGLAVGWI